MRLIVLLLTAAAGLVEVTPSATPPGEILMATLGGTRSHTTPFLALGRALASRGHNVTLLSAFHLQNEAGESGVRILTPRRVADYVARYMADRDLLGARMRGEEPVPLWDVLRYGLQVCEAALTAPETRTLLHHGQFSLLLLDGAFPDCLMGLAHRLGTPFMMLNTIAFHPGASSWAAGSPAPFSVTPFPARPFTDRMGLLERAANSAYHLALNAMHTFFTKVLLEPMMRRTLGSNLPSVSSMASNVSFVLQNGFASVSYPRAYFPDVVEIGCLHCRPARPLPQNLERFVSGGERPGFVLLSMGSGVRAANMPTKLRDTMAAAISRLPYRVLWKWEENTTDQSWVPENVMLQPWLPQQDLLGHPLMKAFITHGGLLSLLEASYHGCPLVSLPVFCDHDANAAKAELDGYSLRLDLSDLTAASFLDAVNTVIRDSRFSKTAKKRSVLLRDQPVPPLMKAVFWTEYVLRHQGDTLHLQSPARHMSWIQFYLVDVTILSCIVLMALVYLLATAIKILYRLKSLRTIKKTVKIQ